MMRVRFTTKPMRCLVRDQCVVYRAVPLEVRSTSDAPPEAKGRKERRAQRLRRWATAPPRPPGTGCTAALGWAAAASCARTAGRGRCRRRSTRAARRRRLAPPQAPPPSTPWVTPPYRTPPAPSLKTLQSARVQAGKPRHIRNIPQVDEAHESGRRYCCCICHTPRAPRCALACVEPAG